MAKSRILPFSIQFSVGICRILVPSIRGVARLARRGVSLALAFGRARLPNKRLTLLY